MSSVFLLSPASLLSLPHIFAADCSSQLVSNLVLILASNPPHGQFTRLQRSHGAMDLSSKLILQEIQKSKEEFWCRFDDHDLKWECQFTDLNRDHIAQDATIDTRLNSLEFAWS